MQRYDSYVICTSPRSGSTLLCSLLVETGVAGNPQSYFHRPSLSAWSKPFNLESDTHFLERDKLKSIFDAVIAKGSLDTGMFGLRLQRHSFDFFTRKLRVLHPGLSTDADRFQMAFGNTAFIHLSREDKVAQAVSYVKAEQTGLWHMAPDGQELERLTEAQEPAYDRNRLADCLQRLQGYEQGWEKWFLAEKITPYRVNYEALSSNPLETLKALLNYMGLNQHPVHEITPGVAKLADRVNSEWAARFRLEDVPT